MKEITFNKNLTNRLITKIPKKISTLGLYFSNEEEVTGYIRFYRDSLIAIYLIVKQTNKIQTYKKACILKYKFIDNDFVFTEIYLRPKNLKYVEYRYNQDMELNSEYTSDDGYSTICKIGEDGKLIKYIMKNQQKEFKEYIEYLERKEIITINKKNPNGYHMKWFNKEPGSDIYLNLD